MSKEKIVEYFSYKMVTLFDEVESLLKDAVEEAYDEGYDNAIALIEGEEDV